MKNQPLRQRVARNSIIVAAGDWALRLISVISMVILARLLNPADFGLSAAAAAIIVFLKALTSVGQVQYLVQKTDLDQADLNTAWTARLLYSVIATTIILTFSWNISTFFNEPKMQQVLLVLAWIPVLDALRSIGLVVQRRELNFAVITKLDISTKLISFTVTIALAIALRDYWALVIGEISATLALMIGSHIYAPHSVRISLSRYKLQWGFVKWMYIQGILNLLREKIDTFLVTRYLGIAAGGQYSMALRLGDLAVNNFMRPLSATLYSGFSKIKNDPAALRASALEASAILLFIIAPILVWLSIATQPLVTIVLGDKWTSISPIIPTIAAMFCVMQLISPMNTILIISGKFKESVFASAISIIPFIASILFMASDIHLEWFALARALTIALSALVVAYFAMRILDIGIVLLCLTFWKSVTSATLALIGSNSILNSISLTLHPFLSVILSGILVLTIYLAFFYLARALTGKNGYELDFIHKLLIPTAKSFVQKN